MTFASDSTVRDLIATLENTEELPGESVSILVEAHMIAASSYKDETDLIRILADAVYAARYATSRVAVC
jgi:hypothetical protein